MTCLTLATFTNFAVARAQSSSNAITSSSCIQTAAEYETAFNNCLPVSCVSPNLYGVIGMGKPADQKSIYPTGFKWAWVSGYENLQTYSAWQTQACKKPEVTHKILLYVGFGENGITKGADYTLSVMDLSKDPTLFIPSWEAWFQAFQTTFGLNFSLPTQKSLTLTLGNSRKETSVPLDPTTNFAEVTGCRKKSAKQCDDTPLSACDAKYALAAEALINHSPVGPNGSPTAECVATFKTYMDGTHHSANAAEARAMLRYCQDVNPCNSGRGLGFNPAWNASKDSNDVLSHFTGREFVLLNQPLASVGASMIPLTPP